MTTESTAHDIPSGAVHERGRLSLAQKFAVAFLGLVAAVLLINGAIDMWLTYRDARVQAVLVQQEKADAAAERVAQFIAEIEQQLGWTTRPEGRRNSGRNSFYYFSALGLRQEHAGERVAQAIEFGGLCDFMDNAASARLGRRWAGVPLHYS